MQAAQSGRIERAILLTGSRLLQPDLLSVILRFPLYGHGLNYWYRDKEAKRIDGTELNLECSTPAGYTQWRKRS